MRSRFDLPTLVAGMGVTAFGAVLLLDRLDTIDLRFAAVAPLSCALIGAVLVASGLSRRG